MAGNGEDNVDLVAREAAQRREQAAQDAEEEAIRDGQNIYEEESDFRLNQHQPLPGRPLGDYARPVYN